MNSTFEILNLAATLFLVIAFVAVWRRLQINEGKAASDRILRCIEEMRSYCESIPKGLREDFVINRSETNAAFRSLREEVGTQVTSLSTSNDQRFDLLRQTIDQCLIRFQDNSGSRIDAMTASAAAATKELSDSVRLQLIELRQMLSDALTQTHQLQSEQAGSLSDSLLSLSARLDEAQATFGARLDAKMTSLQDSSDLRLNQVRGDMSLNAQSLREETRHSIASFGDSVRKSIVELTQFQKSESEQMRSVVDQRLSSLQHENGQRLEQMRLTVDEKLQGTLEARLGESFKQVSDRLEQVHRGLGEMQSLASGVGDLKRVLTNVKARGTWGEVQLGSLLEQTLAPEQYEKNVATTGTSERVEYAVKLPGHGGLHSHVWLPIDSKFPIEDYQRLIEASERGDADAAELALREIERVLKSCAKTVHDKYVAPPATTDFSLLFLPTEGLYAEAIRRPGLSEFVQREYRVMFAGPTTLSALLNSLRMGFRTLAIQERTNEVWSVLGKVKDEFGKYADLLGKVKKKLEQASNTVDDAERKTRTIHQKLRAVETTGSNGEPLCLSVGLQAAAEEDVSEPFEVQLTV